MYSEDTCRDTFNDSDAIFDESLITTGRRAGGGYLAAMNLDVRRA